jgi:hypothetical protein
MVILVCLSPPRRVFVEQAHILYRIISNQHNKYNYNDFCLPVFALYEQAPGNDTYRLNTLHTWRRSCRMSTAKYVPRYSFQWTDILWYSASYKRNAMKGNNKEYCFGIVVCAYVLILLTCYLKNLSVLVKSFCIFRENHFNEQVVTYSCMIMYFASCLVSLIMRWKVQDWCLRI